MSAYDPFSASNISDLVRADLIDGQVRVVTHEGVQKEFKESFTWGSIGLYARTMAAFANARGGYLIFGVTDRPRIATGLSVRSQTAFDELDRARLTSGLNELFSPEIHWDSSLYRIHGVTLGLIYVFESDNKPVIARKASQAQNANLLEGDILYRYNSRTERAKFPELKRIIDDAKSREQKSMMRHIEELVKAGASSAAVLDFSASTLQGPTGERVLVSQELLDKISFIREGEFTEVEGAPTLRLIGDVVPTNTITLGNERVVMHAMTTEDVISDFLDQTHGGDPREYIRQAASGSTSFVPMHFYRVAAQMTVAGLIDYVSDINTRSQAKAKLLSRLRAGETMKVPAPSRSQQHLSTVMRRSFYERLLNGDIPSVPFADASEAKSFMDAIRSLDDALIVDQHEQLIEILKHCFEQYYGSAGPIADSIRRAACRIDEALYGATEPPE